MSAIDEQDHQTDIDEIAKNNPDVDPEKVHEAREQLRELRRLGRRRGHPEIGTPYGVRIPKRNRGFGTTYG